MAYEVRYQFFDAHENRIRVESKFCPTLPKCHDFIVTVRQHAAHSQTTALMSIRVIITRTGQDHWTWVA